MNTGKKNYRPAIFVTADLELLCWLIAKRLDAYHPDVRRDIVKRLVSKIQTIAVDLPGERADQ